VCLRPAAGPGSGAPRRTPPAGLARSLEPALPANRVPGTGARAGRRDGPWPRPYGVFPDYRAGIWRSRCLLLRKPLQGTSSPAAGAGHLIVATPRRPARTMGAFMTVSFISARSRATEARCPPVRRKSICVRSPPRSARSPIRSGGPCWRARRSKRRSPRDPQGASSRRRSAERPPGGSRPASSFEEWACHSPDFVISLAGPLIRARACLRGPAPRSRSSASSPGSWPATALRLPPWHSANRRHRNFAAPPRGEGLRTTARYRRAIGGWSTAASVGLPSWPAGMATAPT